jgi:hypothetical protein
VISTDEKIDRLTAVIDELMRMVAALRASFARAMI